MSTEYNFVVGVGRMVYSEDDCMFRCYHHNGNYFDLIPITECDSWVYLGEDVIEISSNLKNKYTDKTGGEAALMIIKCII